MNTRRQAAFVVARWIATHDYPQEMLPQGEERAFVQDLVFTTVRRFRPLRSVLGKLLEKWPKGELEALLLVGGAQILYMPEVPDFAAVNETVDAAKSCENKSIAKVVNGVLRNLIRRREEFNAYLEGAEIAERESYPNKLVQRWVERYGEASALALAKWHNEPAETFLAYPPASGLSGFVKLEHGRKVTEVEGYREGAFIVQDPATALAINLLEVGPGHSVLDYCAAPGGKTVQIAWRLKDDQGRVAGRLVAQEVNSKRRLRLKENLERLQLDWVEITDSVKAGEMFDRVLVDAPCSNTGVLRRRIDARWRWTEAKLAEITALQSQILSAAAAHVAPGGILVYSTCSNEPEENAALVASFLSSHPEFTELGRKEAVPFESGTDGAFACALKKRT